MKPRKKLYKILLLPALALGVATLGAAVSFANPTPTHPVTAGSEHSHEEMTEWNNSSSLPTQSGSYYLTTDVTISSSWSLYSGANVSLCLNGHSITKTGSIDTAIYLNGEGTVLNLYDCDQTTHYYYIDDNNMHLGVVVDSLEEAQAGNPDRYGTFEGGYITGGRGRWYDGDYRGGCSLVNNHARFNMYGGTLIGNYADPSHGDGCQAVFWARFGDVAIHGGAIIGNYAHSTSVFGGNTDDGGIHGSFYMDGGIIADNTCVNGSTIGTGNDIHISLFGGKITRNSNQNGNGGGIMRVTTQLNSQGECINHIGGNIEITENWTNGYGGAIKLESNGTLSVSGNPVIADNYAKHGGDSLIADNVYMMTTGSDYYQTGDMLSLAGALESGTNIGIALDTNIGTPIRNWADTMGDADPSDYLFADDENAIMTVDANGNPMIVNLDAVTATVTSGDDVMYFDSISDAVSAWDEGTTLTLTKDIQSQLAVTGGPKTLDLNNHSITYDGGSVITVSNGELHIVDEALNKTTHYYTPSLDGVATLSETPTDYSFEGGYITGGNSSATGGGLLIQQGGIVTFSSGTFFANSGSNGGAAFISDGGALYMEEDAAMLGNCCTWGGGGGGALYIGGNFEMTGGRISDNVSIGCAGAIRFAPGSSSLFYAFKMVGGEISRNYCQSLNPGVELGGNAGRAMFGGTAKVYDNFGTDPTHSTNIIIRDDATFAISAMEPLTDGACLYASTLKNTWTIYEDAAITAGNPRTLTSNWDMTMGEEDPSKYIHSDNPNYDIFLADGQAKVGILTYQVTLEADNLTDDPTIVESRKTYELPACGYTAPEGMTFLGWKWSQDGKIYEAGSEITLSGDCSFTAIWRPEADPSWIGLSGTVYENDGVSTVPSAIVKLTLGGRLIDMALTDASGQYHLNCPEGIYNLVVECGDVSRTTMVEVYEEYVVKDVVLGLGTTDSVLNVEDGLNVTVGGLDIEADAIREAESVPSTKDVNVTMNVEEKSVETAEHAEEIIAIDSTKEFDEFIEVRVEKTIDGVTTQEEETYEVIEIVVPYENINKRDIMVYSYHDGEVIAFNEAATKADGTFTLDRDNGLVRIYTQKFSTFAIAYTPYFNVGTAITLGSYTGPVTVTLKNLATDEIIVTLENVSLDEVAFQELTKGEYLLTITWVDGASNTISMTFMVQ